jgi:hypothetical protein
MKVLKLPQLVKRCLFCTLHLWKIKVLMILALWVTGNALEIHCGFSLISSKAPGCLSQHLRWLRLYRWASEISNQLHNTISDMCWYNLFFDTYFMNMVHNWYTCATVINIPESLHVQKHMGNYWLFYYVKWPVEYSVMFLCVSQTPLNM